MILAHATGGAVDLPVPVWLAAYGAGAVLVIGFLALRVLWLRPRLAAASLGQDLGPPVQWARRPLIAALRAVGLVLFVAELYAAGWGIDEAPSNVAPVAFCVMFWLGLPVVSALFGDVWSAINPLDSLAWLIRTPEGSHRSDPGHWTAAAMLSAFVGLELVYYQGCNQPRVVFWWLVAYTVVALIGARVWGRRWLRHGEGFAALFAVMAQLAPFFLDQRSGRIRARVPLAGLAASEVRPGSLALLSVFLGSTAFDVFSRSTVWLDLLGQRGDWAHTLISTVGLTFAITVVALAFLVASRLGGRAGGEEPSTTADRFVPMLVPFALLFTVAQFFTLFVLQTQNFVALASDPLGRGWNLFGTVFNTIDTRLVSPRLAAYVEVGSVALGAGLSLLVAHDRATAGYRAAARDRARVPFVVLLVVFTVTGLGLLLAF